MISFQCLFFFFLFYAFNNVIFPVNAIFNPVTKPIIDFCSGSNHACAVFNTNKAKCWGYASFIGTLTRYGATSSTVGDAIPYFNPGTSLSISRVVCGDGGICFLLNTGAVKCVGNNDKGQTGLGLPATTTPIGASSGHVGDTLPTINFGSGVVVTSLASGWDHTCVLTSTGKVKCFGNNNDGQLGYGDTTIRGSSATDMGTNLTYVNLGASVTVASIYSTNSATSTCVILATPSVSAQRLKCWGRGSEGQLGYGDGNTRGDQANEMGDNLALVNLGTESKVKQVTLGQYHACALLINDFIKCWGYGGLGQVGSGAAAYMISTGDSLPYVTIDSGRKIKLVATGWAHNCIVYDDQITMKCFGWNYYGHLGQGDKLNRGDTPTTMVPSIPAINLGTGSLKISSLYIGANFNCIIFTDNSMKCFGDCYNGQCANAYSGWLGFLSSHMGSNLQFAELFSPTKAPTSSPTKAPTKTPTPPTKSPTASPSSSPSRSPSTNPTKSPSHSPSASPSLSPTTNPTSDPTVNPTVSPSLSPSTNPTKVPSMSPTQSPTKRPTKAPTTKPTYSPTRECAYDSAKLCKYDFKCMWVSVEGVKKCVVFDCTTLNKGKCAKERSRCRWNKNAFTCNVKPQKN